MADHIVPLERFHDARRVLEGRIDRTPILSFSTAERVLDKTPSLELGHLDEGQAHEIAYLGSRHTSNVVDVPDAVGRIAQY
jgi:hypothetical protein